MTNSLFTFILAEYSQWIGSKDQLDKYHGLAALHNCTVEIDTYMDTIIYTGTRSSMLDLGCAIHYLEGAGCSFNEEGFLECLMPACKQEVRSV